MSLELIIATFKDDEDAAGEMMKKAMQFKKDGALELDDIAVVVMTKDGKVEVHDPGDVDKKHGTVFGAVTGGLVGLLGGPVGAIVGAAAGAATGRTTAGLADYGVPDELVESVKKSLQPGSSALIAYARLTWVERAIAQLEKAGAAVYHETLNTGMEDDFLGSTLRSAGNQ